MKSIEGSGSGNMADVQRKGKLTEKQKNLIKGIICVIGGIMIHICLGTLYTFGAVGSYIVSYFKLVAGEAVNISDSATLLAAEFSGMAVAMPIGGICVHYVGTRGVTLIGGTGLVISCICAKFCLHSWPLFVMVFGGFYGAGLGFAYTAPLIACLKWFPNQKGLISGLITAGFGSGSVIFAPLQVFLINPMGLEPDIDNTYFSQPSILDNVPTLFLTIGGCYAGIICLGTLFLLNKKEEKVIEPTKSMDKNNETMKSNASKVQEESVNILTAARCPEFWFLYTMFMAATMGVLYIATFWKNLALNSDGEPCLAESSLAAVAAVSSASNAFGRIMWGRLLDMWGWKIIMTTLTIMWSASIFMLSWASNMHAAVYVMFIAICFCCLGGNFALFPAITIDVFGHNSIAKLYGFIFSAQMVSSFVVAFCCRLLMQYFSIATLCRAFGIVILYPALLIIITHFAKYEWKPHPCCTPKQ